MAEVVQAGGVTVRVPQGFSVDASGADGLRRLGDPAIPSNPKLRAALSGAGFTIDQELVIAPDPGLAGLRRSGEDAAPPEADVAVADGESAVVLVEGEGQVFAWRLPDAGAADGRRSAGGRVLRFSLAPPAATPPVSDGERRRIVGDWIVDRLVEPVRAYVLRYAATWTIDQLVRRIEDKPSGRVLISPDPAAWHVQPNAPRPPLPGGPLRVLLMVHGTFSSTYGSFAALAEHDDGKRFLAATARNYDLILGHDHRTLIETPEANARAILDDLRALALPAGTTIDAVAYSRGGLVYRCLAEQLLPEADLPLTIGRTVFVGCTNGGTHLAEPRNWGAMIDLYTNIVLAASRALAMLNPATAVARPFVDEAIRTVGRFVQALAEVGIGENQVPGLAAMRPTGALVTALNGKAAEVQARYHVVSSDFEPRFEPRAGITRELAQFLADRVLDRLIGGANDLVVDTASMAKFGAAEIAEEALFAFGSGQLVYHTTYFANPDVARALSRWLLGQQQQQQQHQTSEPPLREEEPAERRGMREITIDTANAEYETLGGAAPRGFDPSTVEDVFTITGRGTVAHGEPRMRSAAPEPVPAPPPQPSPEPPAFADPDEMVGCGFAAEMDSLPQVAVPTGLHVTVSREMLEVADGAAAQASEAPVAVNAGMQIRLRAIAVQNCTLDPVRHADFTLVDSTLGEFAIDVPAPGRPETVRFTVRGTAPGAARVLIEARQPGRLLASFALEPYFIAVGQDRLKVRQNGAVWAAPAQVEPVVLRIYETFRDGQISLKFYLECEDKPNIGQFGQSQLPPGFDVDRFTGEMLGEFENAWRLGEKAYDLKLRTFIASARRRANQIIPADIREQLWKHRGEIKAVQVISEQARIPWELFYISDPADNVRDETGFLSEWGLIRWLPGARWPSRTLGLRRNAKFVIPMYLDQRKALKGAQEERAMIARLLPDATELEASVDAVSMFLHDDAADCGLLHFACHGDAQAASLLRSSLLMQGLRDGDTVVPEPLTSDVVGSDARFSSTAASTLVFVNACRAGQTASAISGVDGFAASFVQPESKRGAGAFVGALWQVDDGLALTFAERFYEAMLNEEATLVDAVRAARAASKSKKDFTWLAYSAWGNPFATVG